MFLGRERRRPGAARLGVPDAGQEGDEGGRRQVDGQPGHRHRAEHVPGGGDPVRRSAAGGGGGPGGDVRHQVRGARRAHGGAGGQGDRAGAEPDPADQGQGPAGDPDQPQHAQRVRGGRPDPHRPAGRRAPA